MPHDINLACWSPCGFPVPKHKWTAAEADTTPAAPPASAAAAAASASDQSTGNSDDSNTMCGETHYSMEFVATRGHWASNARGGESSSILMGTSWLPRAGGGAEDLELVPRLGTGDSSSSAGGARVPRSHSGQCHQSVARPKDDQHTSWDDEQIESILTSCLKSWWAPGAADAHASSSALRSSSWSGAGRTGARHKLHGFSESFLSFACSSPGHQQVWLSRESDTPSTDN